MRMSFEEVIEKNRGAFGTIECVYSHHEFGRC